MLGLFIGIVFSVANIITFAIEVDEFNKAEMTMAKFTSSLSVTAMSISEVKSLAKSNQDVFGKLDTKEEQNVLDLSKGFSFIAVPVIVCLLITGFALLLGIMFYTENGLSEFSLGVLLVTAFPAINIIEYILVRPVSHL